MLDLTGHLVLIKRKMFVLVRTGRPDGRMSFAAIYCALPLAFLKNGRLMRLRFFAVRKLEQQGEEKR